MVCPGCPIPTPHISPTPRPYPTPIKKTPPAVNSGQGYNYDAAFQWNETYLDAYAEFSNMGLSADSSDSYSFETDEMWRTDGNDPNFWQEIGYMTGVLNGAFFTGLFGAYNEPSTGYVEFAIAPNPPSNDPEPTEPEVGASLAVESGSPSRVDYNYNGYTYNTAPGQSSNSSYIAIGVESNSGTAGYVNPLTSDIDISNPQVLTSPSASWTTWPSDPSSLIYYNSMPNQAITCGWLTNVESSGSEENEAYCFNY